MTVFLIEAPWGPIACTRRLVDARQVRDDLDWQRAMERRDVVVESYHLIRIVNV